MPDSVYSHADMLAQLERKSIELGDSILMSFVISLKQVRMTGQPFSQSEARQLNHWFQHYIKGEDK